MCENRHTLPVLGQEHLKQVLFFSVTDLHKPSLITPATVGTYS